MGSLASAATSSLTLCPPGLFFSFFFFLLLFLVSPLLAAKLLWHTHSRSGCCASCCRLSGLFSFEFDQIENHPGQLARNSGAFLPTGWSSSIIIHQHHLHLPPHHHHRHHCNQRNHAKFCHHRNGNFLQARHSGNGYQCFQEMPGVKDIAHFATEVTITIVIIESWSPGSPALFRAHPHPSSSLVDMAALQLMSKVVIIFIFKIIAIKPATYVFLYRSSLSLFRYESLTGTWTTWVEVILNKLREQIGLGVIWGAFHWDTSHCGCSYSF